jgi:hypothetical protein
LPAIDKDVQKELVRVALAVEQAIYADDASPPPEIRVYFQALKYIAAVSGAPECKKWYGYGVACFRRCRCKHVIV